MLSALLILGCQLRMDDRQSAQQLVANSQRIVFLGDSTTYQGHVVAHLDALLRAKFPQQQFEIINLGLSSETVSGLSEAGHANGKFSRPVLSERLSRVLEQTQPDLVIATYGINCGIYQDYSAQHFALYQQGITDLHRQVVARGIDIIHLTSPIYDAQSGTVAPSTYNQNVLKPQRDWLLAQAEHGWLVADLWGAMQNKLDTQRQLEPSYRLQTDGIHLNDAGAWLWSQTLFEFLGFSQAAQSANVREMLKPYYRQPDQVVKLHKQKMRLQRDAWLNTTGHLRPNLPIGLPLQQAQQQVLLLNQQIDSKLIRL
ncbi:hypothetical protein C2869_19240 [Saccharobesus litoralis]|uniref:SGNH hydrolase-type esterase domain-containing protein n=2 Tax=Saccharobesus litoralis TaxID=2172099 RepID=A0A2S0VW21_9ALTE|nr:hypothetical protein C2869_19240 [Saccharobesus litoralis]